MQPSTIVTILSAVIALASALSAPVLDGIFPGHGAYIMGVISLAAIVSGVVINAISKQTQGAPQTGVQVGPLAKDLDVVDSTGTTVAKNVSSTSTLLPVNQPAKGI